MFTLEPENLEGQLLFREMYYAAEFAQGNKFGQIHGNSDCRSVPVCSCMWIST